jgi:lysophospholipase L1-like esterase
MILQADDHVLFYGDSITDAGRNAQEKQQRRPGHRLRLDDRGPAAGALSRIEPALHQQGISGNRIYNLEERLEKDVLQQKPTVVSVLIGINDTWRRYDSNTISQIDEFEASYRRILQRVGESCGARLVVCEPFLLPIPDDRIAWREDLDPRIAACRRIAREFKSVYLPLDGVFAAAACRQSLAYWLPDGVHPSLAGHALIADAWIEAVTHAVP